MVLPDVPDEQLGRGVVVLLVRRVRHPGDRNALEQVMEQYEQYEHHSKLVWVDKKLRGTHRSHCLCWSCKDFRPGLEENCERAKELYAYCVKWGMTTPVFECPVFNELK